MIKKEYYLSDLPEDYKETSKDRTDYYVYHLFLNENSGETITFCQSVKSIYEGHANTELGELEEIEINGRIGLCLDYTGNNYTGCYIVWDNGDYILELITDIDKFESLKLAKSTKIVQ